MRVLLTTLHSKFIHPSLALPYLAAFCQEECPDIHIREFTLQEPKENVLGLLLAEEPEVVAFSVYLWNRIATFELIDALAAVRPGIKLVVGGPEVSFESRTIFREHPGLSAIVHGEGEQPFRRLIKAWQVGTSPKNCTAISLSEGQSESVHSVNEPVLQLDSLPSPFASDLVDLNRGYVYFETSRGCPYHCSFCMSALDSQVRSFGIKRIRSDLDLLMAKGVRKIKLVDRTFNYNPARAREIWSHIIEHNRQSHFHFEIGAHLLTSDCLKLLREVPEGMFQFEIGVQSTRAETLDLINRKADQKLLYRNIEALRHPGNIHLHLDLIAGLPGETRKDFFYSIDRVLDLNPHHLQIEAVKILPGAPLREQSASLGMRHDPNPPYMVLQTPDLSFYDLESIRMVSRLLDLTLNSGRCQTLIVELQKEFGRTSQALMSLAEWILKTKGLRHPVSQIRFFELLWSWLQQNLPARSLPVLKNALARDFALAEKVLPNRLPDFFDTDLNKRETEAVSATVLQKKNELRGSGTKVHHFAAVFQVPNQKRRVHLFFYLYQSQSPLEIVEHIIVLPD